MFDILKLDIFGRVGRLRLMVSTNRMYRVYMPYAVPLKRHINIINFCSSEAYCDDVLLRKTLVSQD